jgi:regulatory protein
MALGGEATVSPPESGTSRRHQADQDETGPEADVVAVAREIALRRLAVRARSRKELAQDLARRDVPPEAAAQVLDRLAEVGLIDDAAFASQWVESRGSRSGASRLKQELRQKGVADEHIADAVGGRDDDADLMAARALAQRKVPTMGRLDRAVRERRLGALLARRGFSTAAIRRVLSELRDPVDGVGD